MNVGLEQTKQFAISYINKNEASFLLGLLRPVSCTHCPDFFDGCAGGAGIAEQMSYTDRQFLNQHMDGTENYLCGKLRNIIALNKAEQAEIENQFETSFNKRISLLSKRNIQNDDDGIYVLISDKQDLRDNIKLAERQMVDKVNSEIQKINDKNIETIELLKTHINEQADTIDKMQDELLRSKRMIIKLKNSDDN